MEEFVLLHKELLNEEHDAEREECLTAKKNLSLSQLLSRGVCISRLQILSMKTGLYGRTIIKLSVRGSQDRPLPSHSFSPGDLTDIHIKHDTALSGESDLQGVITSVKENFLSVALDGEDSSQKADEINRSGNSLIVFKTSNEVTHKRLQKGLDCLIHHSKIASSLISVCFDERKPSSYSHPSKAKEFCNERLNESQKEAVGFALNQRELAVIHGPPGTGKTTTVVELISQFVANGQKVLTCAPSNIAVDNILEKLSKMKITKVKSINSSSIPIKVVRIGHPARILSQDLHRLSLDALVARSDGASIVQDVRKDLDNLHLKFKRKHNRSDQVNFREEKKLLMKELKEREKKAIYEILSSADVVLATNVGAHIDGPLKHLPKEHFQVVVIDECGQALEASCWIPLLQAPKAVLAGDHLQLPPTVKSNSAATKGLSRTLLERVVDIHGDSVVRMLDVQYRMNHKIMNWSSQNMYESKLKAHTTVENHLLKDLPGVSQTTDTTSPLVYIDTAGCDMNEVQTEDHESIGNPGEAEVVADHVSSLIDAGVDQSDIAVISPYNMQVDILRKLLHQNYPRLEIKSVDGFQGREKEAVVLSLVRSNDKGVIGFLSDDRRTNVAVTRAKRHLAVICDSSTVSKHSFLNTLIEYLNEHGEVRSAHEFSSNYAEYDGANFAPVTKRKEVKTNSLEKKASIKEQSQKQDLSKVKKEYRDILLNFMKDCETSSSDKKSIEFSSKLKSFQRLAIHELCEEFGLKHESVGENRERKIIVSFASLESERVKELSRTLSNVDIDKGEETQDMQNVEKSSIRGHDDDLPPPASSNVSIDEVKEAQDTEDEKKPSVIRHNDATNVKSELHDLNEDAASKTKGVSVSPQIQKCVCEICGGDIPPANIQLHKAHCERLKTIKEKLDLTKTSHTAAKPKLPQKSNKKKSKSSKVRNAQSELNKKTDDELIEEAIHSNSVCSVLMCNQSVTFSGLMCKHCNHLFCLEHQMPEVHGCGQAANKSARRHITGGVLKGTGSMGSASKHAHLQQKLNKKLKEMGQNRKPNVKPA